MPVRAIPAQTHKADRLETSLSTEEIFRQLLSSVEVANKRWVYEQYDNTVQGNTITRAGSGDGNVIHIRESGAGLSMSVDCNPRFCYLDPYNGAKIAVATSGRNSIVRGAKPLAISDCLNFGSPNNPEVMWAFKEACEGIKQACQILNTPVVSGNVSLHNQSDGVDIYPTPSIVSVGLIDDAQNTLSSQFQVAGNVIVLLGEMKPEFGGSLAQKILEGRIYGQIPNIDLKKELALWNLILESRALLKSAKDVGEGGLAITLAKMALGSGESHPIGCNVRTPLPSQSLFAQSQSCVVLEVAHSNLENLKQLAQKHSVALSEIGYVGGERFCLDELDFSLENIAELYFGSFEKLIAQDL